MFFLPDLKFWKDNISTRAAFAVTMLPIEQGNSGSGLQLQSHLNADIKSINWYFCRNKKIDHWQRPSGGATAPERPGTRATEADHRTNHVTEQLGAMDDTRRNRRAPRGNEVDWCRSVPNVGSPESGERCGATC